jgi:hypothetical protein
MNFLHSLERWDRGFESHSSHGRLCLFYICVRWRSRDGLTTRPRSPTEQIKKLKRDEEFHGWPMLRVGATGINQPTNHIHKEARQFSSHFYIIFL